MSAVKKITLFSALSTGHPLLDTPDVVKIAPMLVGTRTLHPAYVHKSFITKTFTNTKHALSPQTGKLEGLNLHALSSSSDGATNRTMWRTPDLGHAQRVAALAIAEQLGIPESSVSVLCPDKLTLGVAANKMAQGSGMSLAQAVGVRWQGELQVSPVLLAMAVACAFARSIGLDNLYEAFLAPPSEGVNSVLLLYRGAPLFTGQIMPGAGFNYVDPQSLLTTLGLLLARPGPMTSALLGAASTSRYWWQEHGCTVHAYQALNSYIDANRMKDYLAEDQPRRRGGMRDLLLEEPYHNV